VLLLVVLNVVFGFAGWCAADFLLVRSPRYPGNARDADWLFGPTAVLMLVADWLVAGRLGARRRVLAAILAFVVSIPLIVVLVLFLGVWFHFAIGGRL
jgi:hypothetical protein